LKLNLHGGKHSPSLEEEWGQTLTKLYWRKERVRKGVVLQSECRMETKRQEGGLGAPYELALGPTDKARPLNI